MYWLWILSCVRAQLSGKEVHEEGKSSHYLSKQCLCPHPIHPPFPCASTSLPLHFSQRLPQPTSAPTLASALIQTYLLFCSLYRLPLPTPLRTFVIPSKAS